ncbi:uncharacterized protein N7529_007200 [Penicillium soppii]|uniref:uncharacterized protein n=1 Tax=Penicillium soppii TaxID=69789 RepID=UPI0025476A10|nr:uncharacterized protein N7529_007200 [Penicillium soppii]KAJ5865284.1 hypothetical protein N7529_007200 [Penicillium soppii]
MHKEVGPSEDEILEGYVRFAWVLRERKRQRGWFNPSSRCHNGTPILKDSNLISTISIQPALHGLEAWRSLPTISLTRIVGALGGNRLKYESGQINL